MNDLFPSPHAIDAIILRVLTVRDKISDLLVAVIEVALRLHLVLEEVHAGLAAGTVTMQSLMED